VSRIKHLLTIASKKTMQCCKSVIRCTELGGSVE